MKIIKQQTKTLVTRNNNNSADCISPNYVYGCLGGCMSSYCYVGRYNRDKVYINNNTDDIFNSVVNWVKDKPWPKISNQQDPIYYTVDIGCSTDIPLHQKFIDLDAVLAQYDAHKRLKVTFATKYPSMLLTNVRDLEKKPRVRVSLMPELYSDVLEPNTDSIFTRIKSINLLQILGWEVHINFSPVCLSKDWKDHYSQLFYDCNKYIHNKNNISCEVIFMTSSNRMIPNTNEGKKIMSYVSEHKNKAVKRYPLKIKQKAVQQFKELHQEIIPWCNIRYIF